MRLSRPDRAERARAAVVVAVELAPRGDGWTLVGDAKQTVAVRVGLRLERPQAAVRSDIRERCRRVRLVALDEAEDRKSTRLNSSHVRISYAVFCLKKKKITKMTRPASWKDCALA